MTTIVGFTWDDIRSIGLAVLLGVWFLVSLATFALTYWVAISHDYYVLKRGIPSHKLTSHRRFAWWLVLLWPTCLLGWWVIAYLLG